MQCKNILLAVDGSDNSMRAVRYTSDLVGCNPAYKVRLLHIERLPNRDVYEDDDSWRAACKDYQDRMRAFLEDARQEILRGGMAEEAVSVAYVCACRSPFPDQNAAHCSRGSSVSQEILSHMEEHGYGTVVIGRRGLAKAEEFLFGSVSNKIIHMAKGCTVWVVS